MKYVNANLIFPEELLDEIQKYIQGGLVYIPKPKGTRTKWGEHSGSRTYLRLRNEDIRHHYAIGFTMDELSDRYSLSYESIRRIIYSTK